MTDDRNDPSAREARVVEAVMARIARAPQPDWHSALWFDPAAFWRPALAAAAVIGLVSAWSLTRRPARPATVIQALGLPAPVTRWMESGDPTPMLMLRGPGGVQ